MSTRSRYAFLLLTLTAAIAASAQDDIVLVPNLPALMANDHTDWLQLGNKNAPDQTPIPVNFTATSAAGVTVSGTFQGGNNGGLVAVVCPSKNACSWIPPALGPIGINGGDTLIWTLDGTNANGPISLAFSKHGIGFQGVGFWIQGSPSVLFEAIIQPFNGNNPLSQPMDVLSDDRGSPVFLGIFDKTGPNITSVQISGCAIPCNDFAIDSVYTVNVPVSSQENLTSQAAPDRPEANQQSDIPAPDAMLPLWEYEITASRDNMKYRGTMVGRNPFDHGHTKTTVPAYLIPLKLTMPDGTVFDPAVVTGCLKNNPPINLAISVQDATVSSPIFEGTDWMMNKVDVVSGITSKETQYVDAFQRANFWTYVSVTTAMGPPAQYQGTPYQTLLGFNNNNIIAGKMLVVPGGLGWVLPSPKGARCPFGVVDTSWFIKAAETLLKGLANIKPSVFPLIVLDSVILCDVPPPMAGEPTLDFIHTNCIAGYHSAYNSDPKMPP